MRGLAPSLASAGPEGWRREQAVRRAGGGAPHPFLDSLRLAAVPSLPPGLRVSFPDGDTPCWLILLSYCQIHHIPLGKKGRGWGGGVTGKTRRRESVAKESGEHAHGRDVVAEESALAEGFQESWGDTGAWELGRPTVTSVQET